MIYVTFGSPLPHDASLHRCALRRRNGGRLYSAAWRGSKGLKVDVNLVMPLLVAACLLLVPLMPAAVLYLILTPRRGRGAGDANVASGEAEAGRLKFRFNVVGSTATYVILLGAATWIYRDSEAMRLEEARQRADAIREQQAWLVEVPVYLRSPGGEVIPANMGEMQQVRVELEPSLTLASSNAVQFWVIPNNGKFPTARLSLSPLSTRPEILDLNDMRRIQHDYAGRKMSGIAPVWLEIGRRYGNENP
ncbi:MAG TPA: hypothetical protein VFY73_12310 [Ideonella sp.]|uniref:hypothetical protein n=1 Tax=Ideonella sp. TaxID=1929293 RepID=UPI002E31A5EB|nr:hypothetical protein [Ideonella sp.]HEX5684801.1 hypothetical protein [Ideonella sp.]